MTVRVALLASVAPTAFDNAAQVAMIVGTQGTARAPVGDPMMKRSPAMAAMVDYWDLTDALVDGHDAMVAGGTKFLPKFHGEEDDAYKNRLAITKYTNIYGDVVESLSSKPFEQEAKLLGDDVPAELSKLCESVDGAGQNFTGFAAQTFFSGINSAIAWVLVDNPPLDEKIQNRAQEIAAGVRPYWSHVLARNVLEATPTMIKGNEVLETVRIYEPGDGEPDAVRKFIREPTGAIRWELWRYNRNKTVPAIGVDTQFEIEDEGVLTIDVIPLVPFITGRRDGRTYKIKPPMRAAADLQKTLYRNESGLEFTKTMSAYPMVAANGIAPKMAADGKTPLPVAFAPMRVLYAPPNTSGGGHGEWAYLEPAATSLKFLADDNEKTKQDLRELGRQPLTAQSGNLTVVTTAVAAGKARNAVVAWALNLKNSFENVFVITAKFIKLPYDPEVFIYTDFDDVLDDGKDLQALATARAAKDISQETYWSELQRRGTLAPEFNPEEEKARLLKETPADDGRDTGQIDE